MTAAQKAKELVDKYLSTGYFEIGSTDEAKECALIAVEEIMKVCPYRNEEKARSNAETVTELRAPSTDFCSYWEQVKEEILKQQ